jgi:hypothetical protein
MPVVKAANSPYTLKGYAAVLGVNMAGGGAYIGPKIT